MPKTTLELVQNIADKKPSEFETNFAELVTDRIRDVLATKRQEVAQNLFSPPQQAPVETPAENGETPTETEKTTEGETENAEATA